MNDKQIEIYNKVITDFLGYKVSDPEYPTDGYWFKHDELFDHSSYLDWAETKEGFILIPPCSMLFHKNWSWLMKVCGKIGSLTCKQEREYIDNISIRFTAIQEAVSVFNIEVAFKAVYNFIIWYNEEVK